MVIIGLPGSKDHKKPPATPQPLRRSHTSIMAMNDVALLVQIQWFEGLP